MERAQGYFFNGLVALALSLVMWRLTACYLGWLVLWTPGAVLVVMGVLSCIFDG